MHTVRRTTTTIILVTSCYSTVRASAVIERDSIATQWVDMTLVAVTFNRGHHSPNMSFTVGFGGEGKVADEALEGAFAVMSAQMAYESALVRAGVRTEVALVRGET